MVLRLFVWKSYNDFEHIKRQSVRIASLGRIMIYGDLPLQSVGLHLMKKSRRVKSIIIERCNPTGLLRDAGLYRFYREMQSYGLP